MDRVISNDRPACGDDVRSARASDESDRTTAGTNSNQRNSAALALGGTLLVLGLGRRPFIGMAAALVSGALLYRRLREQGALSQTLGRLGTDGQRQTGTGAPADAHKVEQWTTIGKSPDELYRFWKSPENLYKVMAEFSHVTELEGGRSHWEVKGPGGSTFSWEAQIVEDQPGQLIQWESLPGAGIPNEGSVRFRPAPGDRGTEVGLYMRFDTPGGVIGEAAVNLLGFAPRGVAIKALHRLRSLAETGEVPTLERNPSARSRGDLI